MTWAQTLATVAERFKSSHVIATVWHPEADTELIPTNHGNARVLVGDVAQYQLSTGEIVKL